MANVQSPFGFRPVRRVDGAVPNYKVTTRYLAYNNTNTIARGDPVKTLSTGYIDRGTAGAQIVGIFWGVKYYDPTTQRIQWYPNWTAPTNLTAPPSSGYSPYFGGQGANVEAQIIDDPWLVFECQTGGSTTTPINLGNVGNNVNFAGAGAANSAGNSVAYVDQTTVLTTSTLPFRIIGLSQKIGNDNASAYNTVEVVLNNSDFKTLTGV